MIVKWRHCEEAEKEHRANLRQYAHTYHVPQTICLAKSFWKLPKSYRDGIILHEIGHLLAGPAGDEEDANRAVETLLGARIEYVDSPYGQDLERLTNMAGARIIRRRNAIHGREELPYDEWVPAHAVKFNSDGTVEVMTEEHHQRNKSVQFGHFTADGHFHPWRASSDYSSSYAGEGRRKYKTSRAHAKPSDYVPFKEWGG